MVASGIIMRRMLLPALCWVYFDLSTNFYHVMDSFLKDARERNFAAVSTTVMNEENTIFDKSEKYASTSILEPHASLKTSLAENRTSMTVLKEQLNGKGSEPLLTLFTTWKESSAKYSVHNLTVRNRLSLRPHVVPVIFTNETTVAKESQRFGWNVFPVKEVAANGVPVLKYMYLDVMANYNTTYYAYANGDILFIDSLIESVAYSFRACRSSQKTYACRRM